MEEPEHGVDLARLTIAISGFTWALSALYTQMSEQHDVAGVDISVIETLAMFGPTSNSRLARLLHMNQPSMARALDALDQRGLLKRERLPVDRRTVVNSLSDEGRVLADAIARDVEQARPFVFAGASGEQFRHFVEVMEGAAAGYTRYRESVSES